MFIVVVAINAMAVSGPKIQIWQTANEMKKLLYLIQMVKDQVVRFLPKLIQKLVSGHVMEWMVSLFLGCEVQVVYDLSMAQNVCCNVILMKVSQWLIWEEETSGNVRVTGADALGVENLDK